MTQICSRGRRCQARGPSPGCSPAVTSPLTSDTPVSPWVTTEFHSAQGQGLVHHLKFICSPRHAIYHQGIAYGRGLGGETAAPCGVIMTSDSGAGMKNLIYSGNHAVDTQGKEPRPMNLK